MAGTTPINAWPYPTDTDYVYQGAQAIELLADSIDTSVGSGLLAWQSWAPVLSGGWTNGTTGVWTAKYAQIGKRVIATGYFVVGNGLKGTIMNITLPVTAATTTNINGMAYCATTPTTGFSTLQVLPVSANGISLSAMNTAGTYVVLTSVAATAPIVWAVNSVLSFTVIYQAA